MNVVKVSYGNKQRSKLLLRQTPGFSGKWGNSLFLVNQDVRECDYWVVLHSSGLRVKETTLCSPNGLIYCSMEPLESVCSVHFDFHQQFSVIISTDPSLYGKNIIPINLHTWWAGINVQHINNRHLFKSNSVWSYDDFSSIDFISSSAVKKLDRICVITSNKASLPGHILRLSFLDYLMNSPLGPITDVYGGGFSPVLDKLDIIKRYKYHLVLENSTLENYWSEKLADSYLGSSFPLYYGCPNIQNYFPLNSFLSIDIHHPDAAINVIVDAINNAKFESSIDNILIARSLVLNQYNIFAELDSVISSIHSINHSRVQLMPSYIFTDSIIRRSTKNILYRLPFVS